MSENVFVTFLSDQQPRADTDKLRVTSSAESCVTLVSLIRKPDNIVIYNNYNSRLVFKTFVE